MSRSHPRPHLDPLPLVAPPPPALPTQVESQPTAALHVAESSAPLKVVDLSQVDVFSDLPDDSREAFAKAATLTSLRRGEEVPAAALALVVEGELDVSASVVDAPALTLVAGHVMRSRGHHRGRPRLAADRRLGPRHGGHLV